MGRSNIELAPTEPHPAAYSAIEFINSLSLEEKSRWAESFASCAIEGNRVGEICSETLRRVMHGEKVSDRYLLGLAWTIQSISEEMRK